MTDNTTPTALEQGIDQLPRLMAQILSAAQPGVVFSPPITVGNYTVITASEVAGGGGFGLGWGRGPAVDQPKSAPAEQPSQMGRQELASGGGGGGGGGAASRPVATIVIGPAGVEVKPVLDVTKIVLAGITAWGAMLLALLSMRHKLHHKRL